MNHVVRKKTGVIWLMALAMVLPGTVVVKGAETADTAEIAMIAEDAEIAEASECFIAAVPEAGEESSENDLLHEDIVLPDDYTEGAVLSVDTEQFAGQSVSYQWYFNTKESRDDGVKIDGATKPDYTVPPELKPGIYYYYCIITRPAPDSGETEEIYTKLLKVTVVAVEHKTDPTVDLLAKLKTKKDTTLVLTWPKESSAEGYDIFFACGKAKLKKVKSITGNETCKWTKKRLKKQTMYKAVVKAYRIYNDKKIYLRESPVLYSITGGGNDKYTNPKGLTVKKKSLTLSAGKKAKIKASVKPLTEGKKLLPKKQAPKLRYISSDEKIATVSSKGRVNAKAQGSCKIYVLTSNGIMKAVKINVK